eukprot:COSAG01_NODE_1870_length_9013_cov_4.865268_2_plen_58_part_00
MGPIIYEAAAGVGAMTMVRLRAEDRSVTAAVRRGARAAAAAAALEHRHHLRGMAGDG